jgi:hypothetical protein
MNMNMAEKNHQAYLQLLHDKTFVNQLKTNHPHYRMVLTRQLSEMEQRGSTDKKAKQFLRWVIKQTESNFI